MHAPTRIMRTDAPPILRMVERNEQRDPENAAREYGAEFMAGGSGLFFDPAAIEQAVDDGLHLSQSKRGKLIPGAIDPGFARDAATMAVVALEPDGVLTAKGTRER